MNYFDKELHKQIKLNGISEKYLKEIINELFISYELTNTDLFEDDDYNSIKGIVIDLYNNIHCSNNKLEEYTTLLNDFVDELLFMRIKTNEPNYSNDELDELGKKLEYLDSLEQPEQRTKEWYEFRQNRITASDFGIAYDMNPYTDENKIILKKCGHETPFIAGPAIKHGVKYEDVAIKIYENRNNVLVSEYGCISHPTVPFIGASPDGICNSKSKNKNYVGRMLEIKCPKSRKLDGFIPPYYYLQVQGQLETCELQYCDFLECIIKEYDSKDDFITDVSDEGNHNYRKNGMEKGLLIELFDIMQNKSIYSYASFNTCSNNKLIDEWEDNIFKHCEEDDNLEYITTSYWKLEEYSCILVERDTELWKDVESKLAVLWDKVLYHREKGIDDILKLTNPKKEKKNITFGKEYKVCFLDDDDD
tara:strand:- start:5858 stop:7117 length:1260 start_codon:yes stop_codon:yes gene_type:complete